MSPGARQGSGDAGGIRGAGGRSFPVGIFSLEKPNPQGAGDAPAPRLLRARAAAGKASSAGGRRLLDLLKNPIPRDHRAAGAVPAFPRRFSIAASQGAVPAAARAEHGRFIAPGL